MRVVILREVNAAGNETVVLRSEWVLLSFSIAYELWPPGASRAIFAGRNFGRWATNSDMDSELLK